MCDPITLGSAALSGAGAFAQSSAASSVAKARDRSIQAERAQQAQLDAQAAQVNASSDARFDNFGGQQATRSQQLGDMFAKANGVAPATPTDAPASSSNIVNQEVAKQGAKAAAYGDQQAHALGNLRSFGDVLGTLNRGQARDSIQIGQIDNFKAGDAATLPYQLDSASHAGDGLSTIGQLASGVGKLGVSAGLNGASSKLGGLFGSSTTVNPWEVWI